MRPPFLFCKLGEMKPLMPSRRTLIVAAGASLLPPLLTAGPTLAAGLLATPSQTEGPFYPTAFPADMDNDLVQVRGQAAQAMGTVLHLEGRVLDLAGRPVEGALVEIWQCDAQGLYDHPRQPGRERRDSAFQGYGRMLAAADGRYSFRALKPVAYPGRAPHIHFKVATAAGGLLTSQFYIADEPGNERDGVFRDAVRDPRRRERIEMKLAPAPGLEAGALATTMDIVVG
jgi:protocatechuate 3,4-dioxygenase beta subunit